MMDGMERLDRHWWWVTVTATIAVLVVGVGIGLTTPPTADVMTNADLAHALGDTGSVFVSITCRTQRGSLGTNAYNRRCLRIDIDGLCYAGTGETRTAVFVRVGRHGYHVIDRRTVGHSPPCDFAL